MLFTESDIERICKEKGKTRKQVIRMERKIMRSFAEKQKPVKPIESLLEESRFRVDSDEWDTSMTEYGFLPINGNDYSDDEIMEYIDDLRLHVSSPWDCSGQRFTMWIEWHRNPSGLISVIHRIGLDV